MLGKSIENRDRKFETTYLFELPYDKLVAELSQVPRDAIVILLTVFADSEGKTFIPAEVATALSAISPAPVYAPYDTYLGNGTWADLSRPSSRSGSPRPTWCSKSSRARTRRRFRREPIPGKPTGSITGPCNGGTCAKAIFHPAPIVLFKEPSIWDQHRDLVLAVLSVFALQTAFAGALLIQRRSRQRAETLLKESEERMTFTAASVNVGLWQFDRATNELWATEHCRALFGLASDVPLTRDTFLSGGPPGGS